MSTAQTESQRVPSPDEVLTLAEVAALLRVTEGAVAAAATSGTVPGVKLGGEWRFLKRAVIDRLQQPARGDGPGTLPQSIDLAVWRELIAEIERRLRDRSPKPDAGSALPGSTEAVLRNFGVFAADGDLEAQLAANRVRREAARE